MKSVHALRSITIVALAFGVFGGASFGSAGSEAAVGPAAANAVPDQILVGFRPGRAEAAASLHAQMGATVLDNVVGEEVQLVQVAAGKGSEKMAQYARNPNVRFAEPNWIYTHEVTSNDPYYTDGSLWGMYGDQTTPTNQYGSQAGEAWAAGRTGSSSVYVGVIDEGIQYTHPDLDANIWTNAADPADGVDNDGNGYVDDIHGWDFANNDNTIYDGGTQGKLDAHGTHVSGTIGGEGGNGAGVAGINWSVKIISAKFLGRNGGTTANAIKAVDYITGLKTRQGLNIVATNNSWGGGGFSQGLQDAIERANQANILFIAAAGNGGNDGVGDNNDSVANYPSNYPNANVIAVAALTSTGAKASYSNYGATTVDIGAPGSGIYSTLPYNTYGSYSGTSMATPHVTGAAALYASTHAGATAAQIKNAILSSAIPTASLAGKTVTGGRLDVNTMNSK